MFVLPTLAAFLIGFVWPFIQGLYLSFCKFITIDKASFNGLKNYIFALTEADFLHAFWFTALFTVVSTVCINVAALAIALALTREIKGTNLFRSVYFMPNLIGGIVLGYIWNILLNCALTLMGKPLLSLHAPYGFVGLVILMCWQQIGYMMIIYIAGLQSIPNDYLEAARIDGATESQILWKVKLPNADAIQADMNITPHMFRHSFATYLMEEDVNIRYIQKLLGHASITTTQIYTFVTTEKEKEILRTRHPRNKMHLENNSENNGNNNDLIDK